MKKPAFLFFIICFFCIQGYSQPGILKLILKEKFSKVEEKLADDMKEREDNAITHFTYSVLYAQRNYANYDPFKAYDYLIRSWQIFDGTQNEKDLKQFEKYELSPSSYEAFLDSLSKFGLADAVNLDRVEAYDRYLNHFKKAPTFYLDAGVKYRDEAAYKIATSLNTVASFQAFIDRYPQSRQLREAVKNRNARAYAAAMETNTVESFQSFVDTYPYAVEVPEAKTKIHALAYALAEKENTISAYQEFIRNYPAAPQKGQAIEHIHALAFEKAMSINTESSLEEFLNRYKDSKQYAVALNRYEEIQYDGMVKPGDWFSYKEFVERYPRNSRRQIALDSIYQYAKMTSDRYAMLFCYQNYSGTKKKDALISYHDIFTDDGEKITLDLFYDDYDDPFLASYKEKDYALAVLGDALSLSYEYNKDNAYRYDEYIKAAAPRERAFVALQRMISPYVAAKDWANCIKIVDQYIGYFSARPKKVQALRSILTAKWDPTIRIQPIGFKVNTDDGSEYAPVPSADGKSIYFCGKNRTDNTSPNNEDVYVADILGRTNVRLITALSASYANEAPECLSSDGTRLVLFNNGNLLMTDKTPEGWSDSYTISETLNTGRWQADAVLSSDGNALLFSSIRPSNYDIHTLKNESGYHGPFNYSSDIYVMLRDENNEWGNPINLGPIINTIYADRSPFLHPDMKTLYFSSNGHGGLGNLDVYKSTRLYDSCWTCWSEPVNLGKEINTMSMDWGYKITTDGTKAYFSQRASDNNEDIYTLNIPPHLRPDYVATITGTLLDRNNNPVSLNIRWEDLQTGQVIGRAKSDPADGSYFIVVPLGRNYGYFIEDTAYFPLSQNIDLRKQKSAVKMQKDIKVTTFRDMIDEHVAVPINNLFFEFGKSELLSSSIPELKRLAAILKAKNLQVELSGHTDNIGSDEENQKLSENRVRSVRAYLVKQGIAESAIQSIGYGEKKPITTNDTEEGRALNRRVEVRFN